MMRKFARLYTESAKGHTKRLVDVPKRHIHQPALCPIPEGHHPNVTPTRAPVLPPLLRPDATPA